MIARLYDQEHVFIGLLKNMKGAKIETDLSNGDKTLSFSWHRKNRYQILPEYYIETRNDEYVVKQNDAASGGYRNISAVLNLEELEGTPWEKFLVEDGTATEIVDYAIAGTGWKCVSGIPESKKRSISMTKSTTLDIIAKVREAFICDVWYDTRSKTIHLEEEKGSDKGAYFIRGLNLKELSDGHSSYDYITCLIPYGADGLTISGVEPNGKNYVENFQYSHKKKARIWEDSSYIDAYELYEAAKYYLDELSKPQKSYQAKVIDLAKMKPEYSALEYETGDTVTLIDGETGTREKQRIIKTVEYPDAPESNTCDISNTALSFEDMQKQLQAAAECVGNITVDNGTVRGSSVDSIDVTQIIGLERYIAENMDDLTVKNLYVTENFGAVDAVIGHGTLTQADVTVLNVKSKAEIEQEHVGESHIDTLYADYAKFTVLESDNIAALEGRILNLESREITADYLKANFADIDFANVQKETIGTVLADVGLITNATIVDGHVTGYLDSVSINANAIKAGTLSVDRLVINGTTDSIIYALNNSGQLTSTHCDTLDGGLLTQRTVTADHLVAGTITANEIAGSTITADKLNVGDIFGNSAVLTTLTSQSAFINAISTNSVVVGASSTAGNALSKAEEANSTISKWCYDNDVAFIDGGKLYAGSVTAEKIAANSITAEKIAANSITAEKIAANAITAEKMAANAITAEKIAANAITADKINVTDLFAQDIVAGGVIKSSNYVENKSGLLLDMKNGTGQFVGKVYSVHPGERFTANNCTYMDGDVIYNGKIQGVAQEHISISADSIELYQKRLGTMLWGSLTISSDSRSGGTIAAKVVNQDINSSGSEATGTILFEGYLDVQNSISLGTGAAIYSSLNTGTYLNGNRGGAIINSDAGAGSYVMLDKLNSTNGYFTDGVYQSKRVFNYTARSTVNAGTNGVSSSIILLDESGGTLLNSLGIYGNTQTRSVYPETHNAYSLGTSAKRYSTIYAWTTDTVQVLTQHCYTRTLSNGGNKNPGNSLYHPVVTVPGTDNRAVNYINSNSGTPYSVTINGQWGASSWASHNIVSASSDIRLKENISDTMEYGLKMISKIRVRQFDWKESGEHQKIGFIADELEAIDDHFAFGGGYEEDGSMNVKSVDTFYMMGYVVKGMQELSTWKTERDVQIENMQQQIYELQFENQKLKKETEWMKQAFS